jgi:O-antigen ligase
MEDALVCLAFAAVPLASSDAFSDRYTTVKWYLVHGIAAAWLTLAVCGLGRRGWPGFVRRHAALAALFAALGAWSVFRSGVLAGLAPAADRAACAAIALCAAWRLAADGGRTGAMVAGASLSAAATIALGLAQAAGATLPARFAAREGPAALFGNVNMAAQFVGLALVLVLSFEMEGRRRAAWNALRAALGLSGAVYLYLLGSRSVLLALAAAGFALAGATRRRAMAAVGAAAALLLAAVWLGPSPGLDPAAAARKSTSIGLRLALWSDTVALVRDHPLFGVGARGFEHAFVAYQAAGRLAPDEALVYTNPHDEYLRYLAEDGAAFAVLAAVLAGLLVAQWRRAPGVPPPLRALVVGWSAFLAVEAVFQFPLALAFGGMAAAVTVGAAVAAGEVSLAAPGRRPAWIAGSLVFAVLLTAASLRVARSETLAVARPDDAAALARACALDPRNVVACVNAAYLEHRDGDRAAAVARLRALLARAPDYPPALKLLGEIALHDGDLAEACRRLSRYDALYRGASSAHASAQRACAEGF